MAIIYSFFLSILKLRFLCGLYLKPRAIGRNIIRQQLPTLLGVTCCVHVECCCVLLGVVAQSLTPVNLLNQQFSTFLLFCDRHSVARHCWVRLHSSSNIVGATHAHYTWSPKSYGLYPSHDAQLVPTFLGVAASVCTHIFTGKNITCTIRSEMINSIMFLKLNLVFCLLSNVFDSFFFLQEIYT